MARVGAARRTVGTMNKATFHSLSAAEQALMIETERPRLLEHDEEALLGIFERVRKQRAKSVSQYRRGAAARVEAKGARGAQRVAGPHRDALKAEVWEDALGRVSARLATLARASAKELKQERLAAARATTPAGTPTSGASTVTGSQTSRRTPHAAPIAKKQAAATKGAGKRRQAARDGR